MVSILTLKKTVGLREVFDNMDCKVLVSLNDGIFPKLLNDYVVNRVFKKCKDGFTANAGLMMGYVKYLKIIFNKIIEGPTEDDQGNLNRACKDLDFLKVDTRNVIFQNCSTMKEVNKSKSYFCQTPGKLSFQRIIRSIPEYGGYFIPEITVLLLIISAIVYFKFLRKRKRVKSFW